MNDWFRAHLDYVLDDPRGVRTIKIPLVIHPCSGNGIIIIIYPGAGGDIDGYQDKYKKLARVLTDKKVGTVIRLGNHPIDGVDWRTSVNTVLQSATEHASI